jgi:peptide chain release factor 1
VIDRLERIEAEYEALEQSLASPEVLGDQAKLREASRKYKQQTPLVQCIREYKTTVGNAEAARELLEMASGSEREALDAELITAQEKIAELEERLKVLLLPPDPNDGKNVIVEIRGAEGGEEANLFARDLFEMYSGFATRNGWSLEVLSRDNSPMGGINQVTMLVKGDTVWTRMRFEGGPHRVQRVPVTESQGRIHTSSATVLVLPEAEEVDVEIDEKDLQIDVYRASADYVAAIIT